MQRKSEMEEKLEHAPLYKLMISLAVPCVLAQLVNLLYNIVDRMYVGHIEGIGTYALAGLGVTFPIIILINAFAMLVSMGGAPRSAIKLGEGDKEGGNKLLSNSVTLLILFAVVLFFVFSIFKENILLAFGASQNTLPYALDYLSIYLYGTIFVMFSMGLNMFITAQGFTKIAMCTTLIGCGLNIVLDPLFIFVFHMGVKGAALATIISQAVSAIWVVQFLLSKKSILRIQKKHLKLDVSIVNAIFSLGISAFVMQATECVVELVFNKGMMQYGGDKYVALAAVLFSLCQLLWLPLNGIGQGVQSIMSYNYGKGNYDRVRDTSYALLKICLVFSLSTVLIFELFPSFFLSLFTPDKTLVQMGIKPFRIFIMGMSLMGAQCACQQTLIALGKAKLSLFIASLRKVVLLIPLLIILPRLFSLGVNGCFLAVPASDIISVVVCMIIYFPFTKKTLPKRKM